MLFGDSADLRRDVWCRVDWVRVRRGCLRYWFCGEEGLLFEAVCLWLSELRLVMGLRFFSGRGKWEMANCV